MPVNQRFEKSTECPTNESLLAFLQAAQEPFSAEETLIVEHLSACEFCELTVELLRAYGSPPLPDPFVIPSVPEHLRQLFHLRQVHK